MKDGADRIREQIAWYVVRGMPVPPHLIMAAAALRIDAREVVRRLSERAL